MGEREVGGDWGQIRGMLLAWVLWEPQWHREGRGDNWLPSLCCSGCSACKATLGHLSSLGWCLSLGNGGGSMWVCCNVLSCRVRQQECWLLARALPQDSKGMHLLPALCPLGLCAKPFWDGQEMTQQTPNCEALAGRASSCFAFSDSGMRRSLTVFRHWRVLLGTLAVLSPSSASHQQRGRRNKGGLLMYLS